MSQRHDIAAYVFKVISFSLILLLLGVSCYHAGSFMWKTSGEGYQRYAMILTVFGLLTASHCFSHFIGKGISNGKFFIPLLCVLCMIPNEIFSIATSSASLNHRVLHSVRSENQSSPEYKMAKGAYEKIEKQLEKQFAAMEKLPEDQGTNIRKANEAINVTQDRLEMARKEIGNIDVSSTAAVYRSIESATGMSSANISDLAAVMLSVTPIILGIAMAGPGRRRSKDKEKVQSGKKSEARLKSVA